MAAGPIEVKLEVTSKGSEITAQVKFINKGKDKFLLERANTCPGGECDKQVFTVTTPKGEEVPYTGKTAKRGEPGPGDYVELPAQGELSTTVRLDPLFAFPAPGPYVVKYDAFNPGLAPDESLLELESNSVSFRKDR